MPMSSLARKGTAVLRRLTESAQAVLIKVQGQGAMVTLSRSQYDEMIDLLQTLQQDGANNSVNDADDEFTRTLGQRFDTLVATMNRPGSAAAMDAALFADTDILNSRYRPGATEIEERESDDLRPGRRQRRG